MKTWINILFYIICFFVFATVIYRLALCVPPIPGTDAYLRYCRQAGLLAAIVSAITIGLAFCLERYLTKK